MLVSAEESGGTRELYQVRFPPGDRVRGFTAILLSQRPSWCLGMPDNYLGQERRHLVLQPHGMELQKWRVAFEIKTSRVRFKANHFVLD